MFTHGKKNFCLAFVPYILRLNQLKNINKAFAFLFYYPQ